MTSGDCGPNRFVGISADQLCLEAWAGRGSRSLWKQSHVDYDESGDGRCSRRSAERDVDEDGCTLAAREAGGEMEMVADGRDVVAAVLAVAGLDKTDS